ncbi:MAG: MoaD family protein [Candidatus Hadarchaeum sp.]|uniref:MoaD family protein n=1 Tax=Candidatus Hadarchaeum sp. TaxID=2883567 RepID=UPI003D104EDA
MSRDRCMKVKVKFIGAFRDAAGVKEAEIEGVTNIDSLFKALVKRFGEKLKEEMFDPKTNRLLDWVFVSLNGKTIRLPEDLDTSLKDGDVVVIYPPLAGG